MKTRKKQKNKSVKNGGGFRGIKRFSATPRKSTKWCIRAGSTLENEIREYMKAHYVEGQTLEQLKTKIKNSNDFRSWFNECHHEDETVIKTDTEINAIIEGVYNGTSTTLYSPVFTKFAAERLEPPNEKKRVTSNKLRAQLRNEKE